MELITFKITTDSTLLDDQNHITPYVSKLLTKIYLDLPKGKESTLKKLLKYTVQFSKVPTFKNYLTAFYALKGNIEKANEANLWLLKEHPNYLFGKINYANTLIDEENALEAKKILGDNLLLNELYPERNEFHLDEVMAYFSMTIKYLFSVEKEKEAKLRLDILKEIDDEHPKYIEATKFEIYYNLKYAKKRFREEQKLIKQVPLKDRISQIQTTKAPVFFYKTEIDRLYNNDLKIDDAFLNEFSQLDQDKLVDDLILVLKDSISRFNYFYNKELDEFHFNFPIHALLILSNLKNQKATPTLFEVLRQDNDYIDFWYGDTLSDIMSLALFHSSNNDILSLISFIKEPNIYGYSKSIVAEVLMNIGHQSNPITRSDILIYCEDILDFFIENHANENIVDTEFLGLFISELIDYGLVELLDKIKVLFDLNVVGYWVCGNYNSVKKDIKKENEIRKIETYNTLKEIYDYYNSIWWSNDNDIDFEPSYLQPITKEIKLGRNEPCHCGSGKKYKKCCIK